MQVVMVMVMDVGAGGRRRGGVRSRELGEVSGFGTDQAVEKLILLHRGGEVTSEELGRGSRREGSHAISGHGIKPPVWVRDPDDAACGCGQLCRDLGLLLCCDDSRRCEIGQGRVCADGAVHGLLATLLLLTLRLAFAELFLDPSVFVVTLAFAKEFVGTLVDAAPKVIILVCIK